jgi:hypothetical protein
MNELIFATSDVDGDFEMIRAAGAEVLQEPMTQPYGVRDCAFRDPSGNMIRFSRACEGRPARAGRRPIPANAPPPRAEPGAAARRRERGVRRR